MLAVLVAGCCAATGTATANRSLSVTTGERFSAATRGLTITSAVGDIICAMTLTGSLHRSISKTRGALSGYVTAAQIATPASCTVGGLVTRVTSMSVLGLPWHVQYESFTGTLPNITSTRFNLVNVQMLVDATSVFGSAACLYRGNLSYDAAIERGQIRSFALIPQISPLYRVLGGTALCLETAELRATFTVSPTNGVALVERAPPPPPPPGYVVSLGDSYVSGEGSRWAGNTSVPRGEAAIDALERDAYFDEERRRRETIERCHRSKEPEIAIGGRGVIHVNYACTGATVATRRGAPFKPGLDGEPNSQLQLLRELATRHPREIKLIAVSIGGNDFGFGDIVQRCILAYLETRERRLCSADPAVTERVDAAHVAANTVLIARAITAVRETMRAAGSADGEYKIVVQNYESPIPLGPEFRLEENAEEEREGRGRRKARATLHGCGFWDADAEWANRRALVQINRAVADAIAATGLVNVIPLKLETAFDGRRLCETGVKRIEDTELRLGREAGGADRLEWINQVRIAVLFTEYFIQESLHPNYWAVLALRNCLRRTYVGGRPAATCTRNGMGLEGGEPRMQL